MKAVRPDRDLERRVVGENSDGSIRLGVDPFEQAPRLLRTKVPAICARSHRIQRDQPHRMIFDRVVDAFARGCQIASLGKSGAQIGAIVLIAGQHVNRRVRFGEERGGLRVFVGPAVMDDIAGVNDGIGRRIERVDVGDRQREFADAPLGVGSVERQMGVRDLRDNHGSGRFSGAVQRASGAPQTRDRRKRGACIGPGSAAHHFMLRRARDTSLFPCLIMASLSAPHNIP